MIQVLLMILPLLAGPPPGGGPHGHPPPPPGGGEGPPPPHMVLISHAQELDLSDDVVQEIQDLADAADLRRHDLEGMLMKEHQELSKLLSQDEPDKAAVMLKIEDIGKVETELMKHKIAVLMDIRALLTPAQRDALDDLKPERG